MENKVQPKKTLETIKHSLFLNDQISYLVVKVSHGIITENMS
jgi:hypothetical protein